MLFERVLPYLLAATLLAVPLLELPQPPSSGSGLNEPRNSFSSESLQSSDDGKHALRGTVVNSVTGEPIRGALVQIYFNGQSSMLTGPDGKFQFEGLPNGQTVVRVRKPGFFTDEEIHSPGYAQQMVPTGPHSAPLVLKLIPEGVVYGRISEDGGEPIEGLPIQLVAQRLQNGRKVWEQRPGTTTDEDGAFRIAELPPGNYFLSAGPSRTPVTYPSKRSQPGAQGIPAVFYPSGSDLAAAAPISIVPGRRVEINLTLSPQPFYRVSGTIGGYSQGQSANLQIMNSVGQPLAYNGGFDAASGAFRILWIPAGAYTLRADAVDGQGHSLSASVTVNVNSDLSGIHMVLTPLVTVPIHMRLISSRTGSERFSEQENWFPAYVQLVSRNSGFSEFRYGAQQVGQHGNSSPELQNIRPGTYGIEVNPNGMFYVQSATCGAINLLESDLTVASGGSVQPIEIVLRDDVAFLSGNVSADSHPITASILAISEHSSAQPIIRPADPNGGFQIGFLPPGEYKILAIDHPDQLEYTNPEVMRKYLSRAREITLSPDQAAKIDLELVNIGE